MKKILFLLISFYTLSCSVVKQTGNEVKKNLGIPQTPVTFSGNYDFVAGKNIIATEDIMQTNVGDFPKGWNTNSSAQVVNMSKTNTHWLEISKAGRLLAENFNRFPENFTLEMDIACSEAYRRDYKFDGLNVDALYIGIVSNSNPNKNFANWFESCCLPNIYRYDEKNAALLVFYPNYSWVGQSEQSGYYSYNFCNNGEYLIDPVSPITKIQKQWYGGNGGSLIAHLAIWRTGNRLRVYLNKEKIIDLPKAIADGVVYNALTLFTKAYNADDHKYYISNLKLAID
jgi:hypothetical protein